MNTKKWSVEYYKPSDPYNTRTMLLDTERMNRFLDICNALGIAAIAFR